MRRNRSFLCKEPQPQSQPLIRDVGERRRGSGTAVAAGGLFASASTGNVRSLLRKHHQNNKSVYFDRIEILEFPIELGDHPCVSSGAPIQIGWEPKQRNILEIDSYELQRLREGKRPRNKNVSERSLTIPAAQRQEWLLTQTSYKPQDIDRASKTAKRDKKLRERSADRRDWDGIMWAMEKTGRQLRKVVLGNNGNNHHKTTTTTTTTSTSNGNLSPKINKRRIRENNNKTSPPSRSNLSSSSSSSSSASTIGTTGTASPPLPPLPPPPSILLSPPPPLPQQQQQLQQQHPRTPSSSAIKSTTSTTTTTTTTPPRKSCSDDDLPSTVSISSVSLGCDSAIMMLDESSLSEGPLMF